jgi:Arc/MetJ family transcription regulator
MTTNLAIDDQLINAAVKLGGHPSKKAAVTAALKEYIQHHRQKQILSLFGQIEYDPDYDYKKERKREE